MKKIGDIMSEMGFKKDSSEATQKAFLKYLIRTGLGVEPNQEDQRPRPPESKDVEQLEFSFLAETSYKPRAG